MNGYRRLISGAATFDALRADGPVSLRDWGFAMLHDIDAIGALLDKSRDASEYADSIAIARERLENPDLTPSARVLRNLRDRLEAVYGSRADLLIQPSERAYRVTLDLPARKPTH